MNGQTKRSFTFDEIEKITDFYRGQQSNIPLDTPYSMPNISEDNLQGLSSVRDSDIMDFLPNIVKKAYNESITGMSQQLITGEQRFKLDDYEPGVLADIGAGILSFFMPADFIATIAGGGVGGLAGKAAAKTALGRATNLGTKKLLQSGTSKKVTDSMIKAGTEKILNEAGRQSAGFGFYSGIASALKQKIDTDDVNWRDVLTDTAKGSLSAGVGGAVLGRAGVKGTAKALAYTQEAAAFGTVDPLLQGRLPNPMDYVNSIGFALGLSGVAGAPGAVRKLNAWKKDFLSKESVGEFTNLSKIDIEKQSNIANIRAEIDWVNKRGLKRWESVSPAGDISFADVSIIKKIDNDKGSFFKIIDNNTQKQQNIKRSVFFRKYKESDKSRIKTESAIYDIGKELGYDIDAQLRVYTNDKAKRVADLNDRDLNNFHQMYFKEYQNRLFRKQFAQYSYDIPQGDFFVHAFGEKAANMLRSSYKTFSDKGSQAVVKTLFDVNDGIAGFEARSRSDIMSIQKMMSRVGANKARRERIWKEATGREPVTESNREIVNAIKKWSESRFEYARSGGIIPKGKIEKYLPEITEAKYKEAIFDDYVRIDKDASLHFADKFELDENSRRVLNRIIQKRFDENTTSVGFNTLINKILIDGRKANPNMTYADAYMMIREDIRPSRVNPHGFIERARKFSLPDELLEKDPVTLMAIYDSRLGRRVELSKVFGRNNEGINKALTEIGSSAERRRLTTLVEQISGFSEVDLSRKRSPELRKFVQDLMGFQAMTKIAGGDATIANLFQTMISTMPVLGITRTAKGFMRLLDPNFRAKLPTVYTDFIREIVGEASSTSRMRKWSDRASQISGFTPINKFNNLLASATATVAIDDYLRMYNKNPNSLRGKYAKDKLRKLFNIEADKPGTITDSKIDAAVAAFSKRSQLQRDYLREQTWLGDDRIRPLLLFKSFGVKQAGFITQQIREEMQRGNPLILARLAVGGMAGGAAINYAKNFMSNLLAGRDFEPKEDTAFNEFVQSFGSVGAFGMLSEFMDAEDLANQIEFTLKPVFYSDLEKGIDAIGEFIKSVDEFGFNMISARRAAYKASPILGTNVRRLSERFIATEAQRRNAQSSRKGRVRTDALKTISEGNADLAIKRVEQWNRNNPKNPITYEDINYKQLYKYLMKKHMKVETEQMDLEQLRAYREFMRR